MKERKRKEGNYLINRNSIRTSIRYIPEEFLLPMVSRE